MRTNSSDVFIARIDVTLAIHSLTPHKASTQTGHSPCGDLTNRFYSMSSCSLCDSWCVHILWFCCHIFSYFPIIDLFGWSYLKNDYFNENYIFLYIVIITEDCLRSVRIRYSYLSTIFYCNSGFLLMTICNGYIQISHHSLKYSTNPNTLTIYINQACIKYTKILKHISVIIIMKK